jgi:hypothetical protein
MENDEIPVFCSLFWPAMRSARYRHVKLLFFWRYAHNYTELARQTVSCNWELSVWPDQTERQIRSTISLRFVREAAGLMPST